ncbi:MAG: preprotein translocase subunit SecA [Candidatus Marinimicrobia bacterium]|nr:preprotein translocase subunit SecA [Candidatus Neomarinimicrobiota bacterium]
MNILTKLFGGTKSERDIRGFGPQVEEINAIFATLESKSDDDLIARLGEIRQEITDARDAAREIALESEELDDMLQEAEQAVLESRLTEVFAIVKDACRRLLGSELKILSQEMIWNMVPFDVQLMGGIVLHKGRIAEMKTGEGKTLVATMPMVLNSLTGRGVHLITVNDYLAQRDSQWMGQVYRSLGLSVGCILNSMSPAERREQYACDITYGTNNEFGFDYLRDNMSVTPEDQVQRGHMFAIVDEVDSVLIDEARTPLIISGQVDTPIDTTYDELKPSVEKLVRQQTNLVNRLVAEAEAQWKEEEYAAATQLLIASRGMPKNRKLMKMYQETGVKAAVRSVENDYMRDKKLTEIDEQLYFFVDEKSHIIDLTDMGRQFIAPDDLEAFIIPDIGEAFHTLEADSSLSDEERLKKKEEIQDLHAERSNTIHHISQLLRGYTLFEKDVEYVVQDGKVLIVDEFTGRVLPGRRYSDGLHQALEAKERVVIEKETQTVATVTIQNYFRMYEKLSGMTGTAETEASEFAQIYKMEVTVIPTHVAVVRKDEDDMVFKTKREKYNAILDEIEDKYKKGQPSLVGTVSVEVSETLSRMLKRRKIPHNVLNAKQHQREAEIVVLAGQKSAVTIATNMAGRGTDIKLGAGVAKAGGLHIIGTERHESRRIDLQLRGRSGRQGDAGSSVFFLSLEDDLMRLFSSDRIIKLMDRMGVEEGEVLTHGLITKSIARAQKRVEARNFGMRKHLLEYDDVMNQQREIIYDRRNYALKGTDLVGEIEKTLEEFIESKIDATPDNGDMQADPELLKREIGTALLVDLEFDGNGHLENDDLKAAVLSQAMDHYHLKRSLADPEAFSRFERYVMLRTIDEKWQQHLANLDHLREGINLRAYGQKNPLLEYKAEAFDMFVEMLDDINSDTLSRLFRVRISGLDDTQLRAQRMARQLRTSHEETSNLGFAPQPQQAMPQQAAPAGVAPGILPGPMGGAVAPAQRRPVQVGEKVGRNDPCPCGSGKKYKKCHGK